MNKLDFHNKLSSRASDIFADIIDDLSVSEEVFLTLEDALYKLIDIEVDLSDSEGFDKNTCRSLQVLSETLRETIEKLRQHTDNPVEMWNRTIMYPIDVNDMSVRIGNFKSAIYPVD